MFSGGQDNRRHMVEYGSLLIAGVPVIVMVIGIVEACKRWGVQGKASEMLAFGLGFFFVALAIVVQQELIPPDYVVWVEVAIVALGGALAATGFYDLAKRLFVESRA